MISQNTCFAGFNPYDWIENENEVNGRMNIFIFPFSLIHILF